MNSEMNSKFFPILGVHSTTFHPELRNERFTLISFMRFPAILSTLQPFQICICNTKNRKLTFWNGPQLLGKRFMANFHASLNSTCKSRILKISTRYQIWGGAGPFHYFWSWTQKWIQNFFQSWGSIPQLFILNSEMKDLHWYLLWGFLQY